MEIILGVVMFTLIVLVLSGLILAARSKLVNAGDVVIEINNEADKQIRTPHYPRHFRPARLLAGKPDCRTTRLRSPTCKN